MSVSRHYHLHICLFAGMQSTGAMVTEGTSSCINGGGIVLIIKSGVRQNWNYNL